MAYLYRHIRLDKNEPFYIGIGTDTNYKRAKNKSTRNPLWKRIHAKTDYEVEIVFDDIDIEFAKEKEIEFIALYGRIDNKDGILANLSGGGEPLRDLSVGVRNKMSIEMMGEGNHFYGKRHSAETRKMIGDMQRGKKRGPLAEATKAKIGAANKGKGGSWRAGIKCPEISERLKGVNHHSYKGKVLCYTLSGELVETFECIGDAATRFNTNSNNIRRVLVGDRNKFKEFIFKYAA
jgi:hypothetical protein